MKLPLLCTGALVAISLVVHAAAPTKPVLFVTQVPVPKEVNDRTVALSFQGIGAVFANALGDTLHAGRGGGLWIYHPGTPTGALVNLTAAATWSIPGGAPNLQTIAVRNPAVSWDGTKAIFSMVIGVPSSISDTTPFFWQLYEIGPLTQGATPVITKVANQPLNYNNVSPCYGSNGRIIFASDRPHNGQAHLWPPREEYLDLPSVSGLWSLDPANGDLFLVEHSPSGSFNPIIDGFGRLIFVRWDHLVRDAEAVTDRPPNTALGDTYPQTFNGTGIFASEAPGAAFQYNVNPEFFPEPRNFDHSGRAGTNLNGQSFNQFTPWMINQDGTSEEIVNHAGRHELFGPQLDPSFNDDANLLTLNATAGATTRNWIGNFFFVSEDPTSPGTFFGVDAPDVGYHGAGQIVKLNGAPTVNPEQMAITYVTHTNAKPSVPGPPSAPLSPANAQHLYRNPLPMSDGKLVAVHTTATFVDQDSGTSTATTASPKSNYDFRVMTLQSGANGMVPDFTLTGANGLTANVTYFAGGKTVTYNGKLWELDPVEVSSRFAPNPTTTPIDPIELSVFAAHGVNVTLFQNDLRAKNEALVVSRNMTARDDADKQQPYNLKVAWSNTQSLGNAAKLYTIGWFQILQADAIRGLNGSANSALPPLPGRRVIATPLHDTLSDNVLAPGAPPGSLKIGDDGSAAVVVPARRAVTWQLLDNDAAKTSVVKERYWITFQPGEIRTCANCHGLNDKDQAGLTRPQNQAQALHALLTVWAANHPFEQWQAQKFGVNAGNPAIAGPAVDFDGDGLNNVAEFAYNTDPNTPAVAPHVQAPEFDPSDSQTYLTLTFHRRKAPAGVTYHVEVSSDLAAWHEGAGYVALGAPSDDGNGVTELVKARALAPIAAGTPQLFLRCRVTRP
jgi:hypothetical protein